MTKFERFREAVMEYCVIPLVIGLILCIANIAVVVFFQTEVMWLIYLTAAAFVLLGIWAIVFLFCFIADRYIGYKEDKAYREEYGDD